MSASLGDFFTKELREKLTDIEISLKGIILIEIPEFKEAKGEKFAVLIAKSMCNGFIGMVPINTNKTYSGNFVTIKKNDYSFLKYDSYICCDVICEKDITELRAYLIANPQYVKGEITNFQHSQILYNLSKSKVVTPALKKKYSLLLA